MGRDLMQVTAGFLVGSGTMVALVVGLWMADRRRVERREDRAALALYRLNKKWRHRMTHPWVVLCEWPGGAQVISRHESLEDANARMADYVRKGVEPYTYRVVHQ